ncbi:MAG: membrane protein insertion efficiency factor YidD [Actinobacteria bacterium]|nr:MAG: membrane protein insertion efficiency factor YidD [Actinomycetota bacterium]
MSKLTQVIKSIGQGFLWIWDHSVGWPIKWLELAVIRAYQLAISPVLPASCRFHPSCSSYGFGAIRTHGSLKGTGLAGWRLLRCNPFNDGGVDPVPSAGKWRPAILLDGRPRSTPQPPDVAAGLPVTRTQT